jgi:hypothetical protein
MKDPVMAAFPRTKTVLLADALYACAPFFEICEENAWRFIVTFKRGSMAYRSRETPSL